MRLVFHKDYHLIKELIKMRVLKALTAQMTEVMMAKVKMEWDMLVSTAPKTTIKVVILSANTVRKPTCLIQHSTHIWNKSIRKAQMASSGTHQPVVVVVEDHARTLTKEWILVQKTSSRILNVKEVQSILCAASKRSTTWSSSSTQLLTTVSNLETTCTTIQSLSISSNSQT